MSNTRSLQQLTSELTPQQLKAAELIVENQFDTALGGTKRTLEEIGEELGVSRQSISKWKKLPAFVEYSSYISSQHTASLRPLADSALAKMISGTSNNGLISVKSLELYYKITGILVEKREQVYVDGNKPQLSPEQIATGIDELAAKLKR
ncbi:phBC6A51 family helix-turn-helix protein [Psychrobacillus sp. FSL K6-1415]|uniref:phBC6A51 family helix-turn-helix protein n=1 Tax=Psychrobacillus sp. FSL K6-1415 TaxID=2921544 RepID=UPI0030F6ED08